MDSCTIWAVIKLYFCINQTSSMHFFYKMMVILVMCPVKDISAIVLCLQAGKTRYLVDIHNYCSSHLEF